MWSESSSATRPSPSRESTSSGLSSGAFHDRGALGGAGVDQAEPAAPVRRVLVGAFEPARHRMALAELGELGAERRRRWCARSARPAGHIERRAPDAGLARIVGAGRDQHRAALAHVARDVVEIDDRQHALARVAVEDDELELVDLLLEQLARREGDQRQLVDRRAVLLLRRAQDGEMDEIDAGVGLEQVAPGALAGMRLAGDQQHAQLVAHAVDRDHGAVVDGRELVLERRRLDLDDVRPGMRDRHVDADAARPTRTLRVSIVSPSRRTVTCAVPSAERPGPRPGR